MADIHTKFVTQTGMEDGGWRMEDGGWRMEDGGWGMGDGGWRMVGKENYMGLCLRSSQAMGHSGLIAGGPIGT